ncbi:LLM class flavin-dependent oxidoreductase [Nocardiopsis sp. RSe5-2]|uniref:LLM class flavin-dependent oxidoreductase n=1 Tax=Nocardiopsis endophytica TaxID=3018445 RepID=A0ABT4UCN6_9ACTN|nr:LLM class flavin-dependent oxidoreductase [Nocardiopsis endophytica]MDA2814234.1 LLM class flavin-dependent oxidoreductase [Nocardiopsis endophytica]
MRLSVVLPGTGPLRDELALAEAAEEAGLDGVWCAEHVGLSDAVAPAAAVLSRTASVEVGLVGLTPQARHPGVTAMEASSLAELAPGRVRLAVGTGVPELMARIGADLPRPRSAARDLLRDLRACLAGERVHGGHAGPGGWSFDGYRTARAARASRADTPPPPVDLCAVRPRMVELAATDADGLSLSAGASREYLRTTFEAATGHLERAGRDRAGFRVWAVAAVSVGPDRRAAAEHLAPVLADLLPPPVAGVLAADALAPGRDAPGPEAAGRLAFCGSYADIPRLVEEYRATGIDELALCWLDGPDGATPQERARVLAETRAAVG